MIFSPNRPSGRTSRNSRASTFSEAPIIRPPTIAPGTEVKPPRISTGKAFSAMKVSANCTPLRALTGKAFSAMKVSANCTP
eukprot:gene31831-39319_t